MKKNKILNLKNIIFLGFVVIASSAIAQNPEMAIVKKGKYTPLYGNEFAGVSVKDFLIDTLPITNKEYLEFVKKYPQWQRSKVKAIFADKNYLAHWKDDTHLGKNSLPNEPVTNVSWFAAKAYCKCQNKRLPTLDEWEYVAMADETKADARKKESFNQYILDWYERPKKEHQQVGNTFRNYWGIYDLHGLVWEWTADFNSVMINSESRSGGQNKNLFCSAAAVGATDLMNYAAFMRYAFRSSVKGNYNINNLGFRCAKDINN